MPPYFLSFRTALAVRACPAFAEALSRAKGKSKGICFGDLSTAVRASREVGKDSYQDTPSAVPQAWQSDNRQHPPITSQPPTRCHPERRLRFASQNGIERRIYAFPLNGANGGGFVSGYAFRRTVNISDHGSAPIGCDRHATYDPDAVGDYAASARITNWIGSCGMAEAIP